jgi:hypothetical protein
VAKLSISTSAWRTSWRKVSSPAGLFMSRVSVRPLREYEENTTLNARPAGSIALGSPGYARQPERIGPIRRFDLHHVRAQLGQAWWR